MFQGMNPQLLKQAMKKLGVKQEEIPAKRVIVECSDKNLIIENPQVSKVNAMGQETLQITGEIKEISKEKFTEDDIKLVIEKTSKSYEEAKKALEKHEGDLTEAILELQ